MREISTEALEQHSLLIASPQYGGNCTTPFASSLCDLAIIATRYNLKLGTAFIWNESLVTRARNVCSDVFMQDDRFQHMMFIDADIGFRAQDVLELLILQIQNEEYDIIGAPYKVKSTTEDRYAFQMTKKQADMSSEKFGGADAKITEPIEVAGIATGFMLIRKSVFTRFKEKFPEYEYLTDTYCEGFSRPGRKIMQYFQAEIDKETGRYLSEDYWFSKRCEEIGIRTWLCPWMPLRHVGTHIFQ